jgi:DNA-binding XRE family transcriptional regulator
MSKEALQFGKSAKQSKSKKTPIQPPEKPNAIPEIDRDYIKKIAAQAKKLRVKSGYSYESFAIHAGINRNTYFRFERSATNGDNYTIALLLKITRGLNISMKDFFQSIK